MRRHSGNAEALDWLQGIYIEPYMPIVYAFITFQTAIDSARLKQAVSRTAAIVPQILSGYDDRNNRWFSAGHDSNSLVQSLPPGKEDSSWRQWDLRAGPQLKVIVSPRQEGGRLCIGMSHILADGAGFLQYLALLCRFYNYPEQEFQPLLNERSIYPLLCRHVLQNMGRMVKRPPRQNGEPWLPPGVGSPSLHTLKVTLSAPQLAAVRNTAKSLGVTLNDLFMAAYVHALRKEISSSEIVIPCPANLRRFDQERFLHKLTVANMTGKYLCRVPLVQGQTLAGMALLIHALMEQLKSDSACFASIPLLQVLYALLPKRLVLPMIKRVYTAQATSYSNLGELDEQAIYFQGATITECYLGGTYRPAPSFQVSVSIFKNVCTLSANMLGADNQKEAGLQVLERMKSALTEEANG
jgi:NRPS condensation-like uncharacterized protein